MPAVSYFSSKVKRVAHVADRQAHHPRSENVARDNGFPAYRGLATHRLYPTDFLEKIKRLLVVCSSICIARGGGGGNFRNFCDAEAGWYKNVNHWLVFLLNELKFIKIENPPIKYIY